MSWTRAFIEPEAEFVALVNLHSSNDEPAARRCWAQALGIDGKAFTKSFIKPDGTGHRTNHLPHGVCKVRMRRSADAWVMTMAWVRWLAGELGGGPRDAAANLAPGR